MIRSVHHNRHRAWWRVGLLCLLAALVFAPVARAVCDLQHVAAAAQSLPCHDDPAGSDPAQQGLGACCDGALASMTQQAAVLPDSAATGALAFASLALASIPFVPVPRLAAPGVPRGRSPAPYEPILLRLPRRLI